MLSDVKGQILKGGVSERRDGAGIEVYAGTTADGSVERGSGGENVAARLE